MQIAMQDSTAQPLSFKQSYRPCQTQRKCLQINAIETHVAVWPSKPEVHISPTV